MPTLIEHRLREQARWTCADGSAVVLDGDGRLLTRQGPSGPLTVIRERATFAAASAHVAGLTGRWQRRGRGSDPRPGPAPREVRERRSRRDESTPDLTPEQQAHVEARILAHQARVQAELERLGQGNRGPYMRAATERGSDMATVRGAGRVDRNNGHAPDPPDRVRQIVGIIRHVGKRCTLADVHRHLEGSGITCGEREFLTLFGREFPGQGRVLPSGAPATVGDAAGDDELDTVTEPMEAIPAEEPGRPRAPSFAENKATADRVRELIQRLGPNHTYKQYQEAAPPELRRGQPTWSYHKRKVFAAGEAVAAPESPAAPEVLAQPEPPPAVPPQQPSAPEGRRAALEQAPALRDIIRGLGPECTLAAAKAAAQAKGLRLRDASFYVWRRSVFGDGAPARPGPVNGTPRPEPALPAPALVPAPQGPGTFQVDVLALVATVRAVRRCGGFANTRRLLDYLEANAGEIVAELRTLVEGAGAP